MNYTNLHLAGVNSDLLLFSSLTIFSLVRRISAVARSSDVLVLYCMMYGSGTVVPESSSLDFNISSHINAKVTKS